MSSIFGFREGLSATDGNFQSELSLEAKEQSIPAVCRPVKRPTIRAITGISWDMRDCPKQFLIPKFVVIPSHNSMESRLFW
jgi:hypothetical protein